MTASRPPARPVEEESADLFDYGLIKDYIGFVIGAVRRRKLLALGVFFSVVALTWIALKVLPRTYHCETKLLAQRNQIIASLGNPGRNMPWDSDMPLRAATETVLRHDNLVSIIKQTDAVKRWPQTRAPILRLKDAISALLRRGPESPEDMQGALVGLLQTRLSVQTGEGTVLIAVDWPDADMSLRLIEAAQQNFLEARHVSEISTITEAISILEGHAVRVREQVDASVDKINALRQTAAKANPKKGARPRPMAPRALAAPKGDTPQSQELTQLQVMLEGKRRMMKDLEEYHQRRLADLKARLTEQRATYSDAHPAVVEIQLNIEALERQEPSQLAALRQDERDIEEQLERRGVVAKKVAGAAQRPELGPLPLEISQVEREARDSDAPIVERARGELTFSMNKFANLLDRIDSARMELDTSRAAFKYRYSVIAPAERPDSPTKPKAGQTMIAGLVAAFFLAVFASTAADLRAGRIVESWQIERQLGLEVLADMRTP